MRSAERHSWLVLAGLLLAAGAAGATEAERKLETVKSNMEAEAARLGALRDRTAALAREVETTREQSIIAARAAQDSEAALSALEAKAETLDAAEKRDRAALAERRAQLAVRLAAIERIAIFPPEAAFVLPESPVETVRSALLLRSALPTIELRAEALRSDLERLARVRDALAREREAVRVARGRLEQQRVELAAVVDHQRELYRATEAERETGEGRLASLAAEAKDLHDLIERVEAEEKARAEALARLKPPVPPAGRTAARAADGARQAALPIPPQPPGSASTGTAAARGSELAALPPPQGVPGGAGSIRPFGSARGLVALPARGEIVHGFGEGAEFGSTSKGITIRTRPEAQVVAPYDGKVVYAGEFRGYGLILIIQHSEGYHSLLSGLSRIDAVTGQIVKAGEPVGIMGQLEGSNGPELYVELRRNGRPIDPLPWLASQTGKVNG